MRSICLFLCLSALSALSAFVSVVCLFVSLLFILLFSAGDLDTADYIAISVSLALTVLILSFIGYFLWRAQHGSTMHTNQEMGRNNPAVAVDGNERVQGVSMSSLPATNQEQNNAQYNWMTSC